MFNNLIAFIYSESIGITHTVGDTYSTTQVQARSIRQAKHSRSEGKGLCPRGTGKERKAFLLNIIYLIGKISHELVRQVIGYLMDTNTQYVMQYIKRLIKSNTAYKVIDTQGRGGKISTFGFKRAVSPNIG